MERDSLELQKRVSKVSEHAAILLGVLSIVVLGLAYYLSTYLPSVGLFPLSATALLSLVLCGISFVHGRLDRLAAEEALLNQNQPNRSGELFTEAVGDHERALGQFERSFVPGITIVLSLLEAGIVYYLYSQLKYITVSPVESERFHLGLVLALGVGAFVLFLSGKYVAGLAYSGKRKALRAPAALTIFMALHVSVVVVAFLATRFAVTSENVQWRNPDPFLVYFGVVVFAIFSLEHIISFILSFYRPKTKATFEIPLYELRLPGLLAQPEGAWKGIAEMIDYQFGFNISETKFFTILTRALLPFVGFQVVVLLLISCLVVVPAGQRGFCERFGQPVGGPLAPGLHGKLPWPIESVYYSPADEVITVEVGSLAQKKKTDADEQDSNNALWTEPGLGTPLFLTAVDGPKAKSGADDDVTVVNRFRVPLVNLLLTTAKVHYRVTTPEEYYYGHAEPKKIIQKLAQKQLVNYLASRDGFALLTGGAQQFNDALVKQLSAKSREMKLGVDILSVSLQRIQPKDIASYHSVMIAEQLGKAAIADSERYRNQLVPAAEAKAFALKADAEDYRVERIAKVTADTDVFKEKYLLYRDFNHLYSTLSYLDILQKSLYKPRKIILATDIADQIISVDLKNDFNPDLLDFSPTKSE